MKAVYAILPFVKLSNLLTRTLSSIVFVLLILGPIYFEDRRIALTLYGLLGLFTLREIHSLARLTSSVINQAGSISIYILLVFQGYNFFFQDNLVAWPIIMTGLVVLFISVKELFDQNEQPFQNVSVGIWSALFIAIPFLGIAYFMEYRSDLPTDWMTISLFALIWINDSGAYLVGRKIGRTKLFERLSPNKTWEGSIGGFLASLAVGFGLSYINGMPNSSSYDRICCYMHCIWSFRRFVFNLV